MHPDMGTLAHTLPAIQHGFRPLLSDYPTEGWTRLPQPEAAFSESVKEPSAESFGRKRPGRARTPTFDRLMAKVNKSGQLNPFRPELKQCWDCHYAPDTQGYPKITITHPDGSHSWPNTHTFMWRYYFGEIPEGMVVMHQCNNKRCCNPNHLALGTNTQNIRDAAKDGLLRTGSRISPVKRSVIINMYAKGHSMKAIAQKQTVSVGSVSSILRAARLNQTATQEPQEQGFLFQDTTPVMLS